MKLEAGDIIKMKDGKIGKIEVANEYWCVVKIYKENKIIKKFYREIEKVKESFVIAYDYGVRDIIKLREKALTYQEASLIRNRLKRDRLVNNIRIVEV